MIDFEISTIRAFTKIATPKADFDSSFTFYYDETNNIKKFYVRENDFNNTFTANFILGGLVCIGQTPNVQPLIDSFKLQKTVKEVKFSHIAKGDFFDSLKSNKIKLFFQFVLENNLYIHYTNLNFLYWSLVDIVDSAIECSKSAQQLGIEFSNYLKNDLYKLARLEIDSVIKLFYNYKYPNIKKEFVIPFIEELILLFQGYIDTKEFHFGLESLRQILEEAKIRGSLPFVMDEKDYILLQNLSQFYLKPIYLFKNSTHIFDNEDSIVEILKDYKIFDKDKEITNFIFVDSQTEQLIQLSDVFVGIMGKLTKYINTTSLAELSNDFESLTSTQRINIDLLFKVIDKSLSKNIGFTCDVNSSEEKFKMNWIWKKMKNNNI